MTATNPIASSVPSMFINMAVKFQRSLINLALTKGRNRVFITITRRTVDSCSYIYKCLIMPKVSLQIFTDTHTIV